MKKRMLLEIRQAIRWNKYYEQMFMNKFDYLDIEKPLKNITRTRIIQLGSRYAFKNRKIHTEVASQTSIVIILAELVDCFLVWPCWKVIIEMC